ncbi:MAG: 6-pyruvoyl trahydropterin synthase family protein [Bacteroidia bacterium]
MPKVYITRKLHISAAHYMQNPMWQKEENEAFYGPCHHLHGHNYHIEVTVAGEVNPQTGYVTDLRMLKQILKETVEVPLDHQVLNHTPLMADQIPSTENLIVTLWEAIEKRLPRGTHLHKIRIWETENNSFEYYGEK